MKEIIQLCCVSVPQTFTTRVLFVLTVSLLQQQQALAQFSEDFNDGDFAHLPAWIGNNSHFTIESNKLKLQAPAAGSSYLATACAVIKGASWEFTVALAFDPSSSNYARIYVASDQENLSAPLNGYFVMLGGNNDEVSLYKQTGTSFFKMIDGRDGIFNASGTAMKVKVTQDNGVWSLFSDIEASGEYVSEGTADDEPLFQTRYFGLFCNYTSTRSDKFYFDDFIVTGDILKDEQPPTLEKIEVLSSNQLNVIFSESIDQTVASNLENYEVDNELGRPENTTPGIANNTVRLFFTKNFPDNIPCRLTISGIKDSHGNTLETVTGSFTFHIPVPANFKDVIMTEIFPDPTPSVGLPEGDFVEIYNRSSFTFNLKGWKLTDGSSTAILPDIALLPHQYLILTSEPSLFSLFPNAIALPSFPSLNNSSDKLVLRDLNNFTVDSINYTDDWYQDEEKNEGGWTLELIDPQNLCSEAQNWIASESITGGSPGEQNSVFANKPDLTGPKLLSVIPLMSTLIELTFDEKLESKLPPANFFDIFPAIEIAESSFSEPSLRKLHLHLNNELQPGISYSITTGNIYDCTGNLIQPDFSKMDFGLPQEADSLDILINEILFNPRPTGIDFVEVVNHSVKFINLKNWSVARIENGAVKDIAPITENNLLLKPGDYRVLAEDINTLQGEYLQSAEKNLLDVDKLPPFNDDAGTVVLMNERGRIVDYFSYTKNMHSIFIKDEEGVSLERISFDQPTASVQNWKSASATVGFATPGYLNSNSRQELSPIAEPLKVEPEIFNPMGGQPDFTQIHYKFEQGGYVANVKIFDPQGYLIKQLANNEILGTNGFFRWDGDRDNGSKVRVGYYMVWFEIFDDHGMSRRYQRRVAVAAQF